MNSTQNHYAQQSPMGPPAPPLHQNVSYSSQNSRQPPQTPQSQTGRPNARPTSKSGFSFRSHKSQNSDGTPKIDLHESPAEKRARRLSTKADPRMAMSEAEPSQLANDHSSSLQPLRNIVHKDINGNPIVDPDRSNPTRSRWERPLDTIRAFEAAIDGNYARKSSSRPDADSRRTSYAGSQVGPMRPQGNGYNSYNNGYNNGYGGGRSGGSNVGSNYEGYVNYNGRPGGGYQSRPDSYYSNNDNNNGYHPNRQRFPRQGSEQQMNGGYSNGYSNGYGNGYSRNEPSPPRDVYPQRGQQQMSYETVTTASGSGSSSDRMNYSTDPSSENSSFDQGGYNSNSYAQQQQYGNGQQNGYAPQPPQHQPQQQQYGSEYQDQVRPLPPAKNAAPGRLGKPDPRQQQQQIGGGGLDQYDVPPSKQEKKKSWLGRTFSKKK